MDDLFSESRIVEKEGIEPYMFRRWEDRVALFGIQCSTSGIRSREVTKLYRYSTICDTAHVEKNHICIVDLSFIIVPTCLRNRICAASAG